MNKITRKPYGIQFKWVSEYGWTTREPIKKKRYHKRVNRNGILAFCFIWYDEFENCYWYSLNLVDAKTNDMISHAGMCPNRFTKKDLKRECIEMPKHIETMKRHFQEMRNNK